MHKGCEVACWLRVRADSISFWVFSAERPVPADEKSGLHFCFRRRMPPPSMRFTRPRCARAGKTTVHPDYGRYTAPITMPPLLSIRTATGSRLITAPAKGEGCTMCGRVGLLKRSSSSSRSRGIARITVTVSKISPPAYPPIHRNSKLEAGAWRGLPACLCQSVTTPRYPTGIWQPDLDLDVRVRVDVKVAAIRQNDLHLAVPSGIGPSMAKSAPCRRAPRLPSPIA